MRQKSLGTTLLALVLVTVACIANGAPPEATTAVTTTTTTAAPLTAEQALGEFQACLTDQGLNVPDLGLDEGGRPDLSALGEAVDQDSDGWGVALTTCAGVIASNGALDLSNEPELAEAVTTRLVAFSTCMRSQGVEAFPDPAADFDGTTAPFPLAVIPVTDPDLGTAAEACAALAVGAEPLR